MDKSEAHAVAEKELESYRSVPYEKLFLLLNTQESFERVSEKNEVYQIEFDFMFDDHDQKTIRVWAIVSYSFWTDFVPVSTSFIIAPNGDFIGE